MAEASRRAARPARRGGLPNALFVVAAAEAPPPELHGLADLVTITLPWGSLLRGALALDDAVAAGIARLVAPHRSRRDPARARGTRPAVLRGRRGRPARPRPVRGLAPAWPRAVRGPPGDRRGDRGVAKHVGAAARPARRRSGPSRLPAGRCARRRPHDREARSALLSSGHVRRPRTVRRHGAADPDRGRRPQPARHPRRPAPHGRLPGHDRPRRRRGAAASLPGLARPADHRHADAPDGRPDPGPRGQGARRPPDHRAVGDRYRGLQGRPARRGRRGLRHQALPLPGAPGADPARPAPPRRSRAAAAPGPRSEPGPRAPPAGGDRRRQRRSRSRRPSRASSTRSPPTSARP